MPIPQQIIALIRKKDPTVTSLDLRGCQIDSAEVIILMAELKENPIITHLDLSLNKIGDEGAKALARNATITHLNLSYNEIGDEGVKALARNAAIKDLDLERNYIGDEGAKALARNTAITHLKLGGNSEIGAVGGLALAQNKTIIFLNYLSAFLPVHWIPFAQRVILDQTIKENQEQAISTAWILIKKLPTFKEIFKEIPQEIPKEMLAYYKKMLADYKEMLKAYLLRPAPIRSEIRDRFKKPDILETLDKEISSIAEEVLRILPESFGKEVINLENPKNFTGILLQGLDMQEARMLGRDGSLAKRGQLTFHDQFLDNLRRGKTPSGPGWNGFSPEALVHVLIDYLSPASKFNRLKLSSKEDRPDPLEHLMEHLKECLVFLHKGPEIGEDGKQKLGLQSHEKYSEIIQGVAEYFKCNHELKIAEAITRFANENYANKMKGDEGLEGGAAAAPSSSIALANNGGAEKLGAGAELEKRGRYD